MNKQKTARLHHYIPQFYLKGFCVSKQKPYHLYCVDKEIGKKFNAKINNIAVINDFYKSDDNNNPDVYEKFLSKQESRLSKAVEEIKNTFSLETKLVDLLFLIAWIFVSNPYRRKYFDIGMRQANKVLLKMNAAFYEQDLLAEPEKFQELIKNDPELLEKIEEGKLEIGLTSGSYFRMIIKSIGGVLLLLASRKWLLLKAPKNSLGFITSDNPASLVPSPGFLMPNPGLINKNTQLFFPISNELAVIGTFEPPDNTEMEVKQSDIANFNAIIIGCTNCQFYAGSGQHFYTNDDKNIIDISEYR